MKKYKLILVAAICGLVLTGCGNKEIGKLTKAGYDAVTSQNYSEALEHFDEALLNGEPAEEVHRGIGLAYMGQGVYTRAITAFKDALSNADMTPGKEEYDINYYMAICYYKLGEYDEAISIYDAIIDLTPKDKQAYFLRGSMKLYLDDVEGAVSDFDHATKISKKDYGLYIDIYQVMLEHGYEEEALKYLDVVGSADNDDVSAYDKGRLCYFQGNYAQGQNYLENARSEGKVTAKLISLLGECYKKEGKFEYAAVVYSSYVETYNDPVIYNQLGLCYVEQGNYDMALTAFQNGIAIKENNTCMQTLLKNEIACYEYLQDYESAASKLEQYVSIYSSDEELEKEYAFLTTR